MLSLQSVCISTSNTGVSLKNSYVCVVDTHTCVVALPASDITTAQRRLTGMTAGGSVRRGKRAEAGNAFEFTGRINSINWR